MRRNLRNSVPTMMNDEEEQTNERCVLESMYESDPRLLFEDQGGEKGGMFMASPLVPQPFFVIKHPASKAIAALSDSEGRAGANCPVEVKFLPPITLNFVFPWDYPSAQVPHFTLTCDWLSRQQLSKLCNHLDEIWEENQGKVILYDWFQFLENEAVEYLGIKSPLDLSSVISHSRARLKKKSHHSHATLNSGEKVLVSWHEDVCDNNKVVTGEQNNKEAGHDGTGACLHTKESDCDNACSSQNTKSSSGEGAEGEDTTCKEEQCDPRAKQDVVSLAGLMQTLTEYDKQKRQEEFDRSTVTCIVCFTDFPGSKCIKFVECDHAFCCQCVLGSFRVKIKEGDVKGLTCLMPKCETQAYPYQVKQVVTPEEYDRYDSILLRITLETMSDVVYCPRRICQSAVIRESNSNMGRCPHCSFVFCTLCKLAYHGPSPCRIKSEELQKLCREYMHANKEKQEFMEKQYGKRVIQRALEEMDSAKWLEQNAKMCPYCGTQIQKKDGCNKMTCTKCRTYFCWLCSEMLSRSNPYGHYSNPTSSCNSLLFEGIHIPDEEDEWWDEDVDDEFDEGVLIF